MAANRIWIMDGHNMIFAIPPLYALQVSDRREEARARLADRLERFAMARGDKVLVVFDGNEMLSNPDAVRKPLFDVVYTRRGEGVADDRILHEARRCVERGLTVTVVTNDIQTLARDLPRAAQHLRVEEFWLKHIEKDAARAEKRVEGDFSDVEREMLARAAAAEAASPLREPVPRPARTGPEAVAPAPGKRARAVGDAAPRERILLKRERGRLRQERRLKRLTKPAGRR